MKMELLNLQKHITIKSYIRNQTKLDHIYIYIYILSQASVLAVFHKNDINLTQMKTSYYQFLSDTYNWSTFSALLQGLNP